jgi:translation initiation factor IF-3
MQLVLDWKIRAHKVMLIDDHGKKIGEMDLPVAIATAKEKGMQVMLINDKNPQLPICKVSVYFVFLLSFISFFIFII